MTVTGSCHCGAVAYTLDEDAPGGRAMVAINLRCADGVGPDALAIRHFDGAGL